jgi:hypothetical protein
MTTPRTEVLDVARRYLFDAVEALTKAGELLARAGLTHEGREASGMARRAEAIKNRARKAHEYAIAAERGDDDKKPGGRRR